MSGKDDLLVLEQAGIDKEFLIECAAEYVRTRPNLLKPVAKNAFSDRELRELKAAGMLGLDGDDTQAYSRAVTKTAAAFAELVNSSLGQADVAKRLGVSTSRIRQRLADQTLYSVETQDRGRVLPAWQFDENGELPGLSRVLPAISPMAHPLAVQRFFLLMTPDLNTLGFEEGMSPRDWLRTGHSVDPVVLLAGEL